MDGVLEKLELCSGIMSLIDFMPKMKLVLYRSYYVLLELHWYSLVPKIVRLCTDLGLNFSGCEKGKFSFCGSGNRKKIV